MRNKLNVTFNLDRLHCYDEGDGWGTAEPYLWTIFFKIDGETCRLGENLSLQGTASIFTTPGSHGNLNNTDVDEGDDVSIPSNIGEQTITLTPIPVPQWVKDLGTDDVSPIVGCIAVLMEEDNISDDGANAGHNALNAAVQDALNSLIPTLGFLNQEVSDADVEALMGTIQSRIENAIRDQQNIFENIWSWLNPDDLTGSRVWRFSGDQLLRDTPIALQQRWRNNGDWEIFGNVSAVELPSCPANFLDNLFSNGTSASTKRMHAFREKEMIRYKGLGPWWQIATDHTQYLQAAMADKAMQERAAGLFKAVPHILDNRDQPIGQSEVEQLEVLLKHMLVLAANDRKARKDISRAVDTLAYVREKRPEEIMAFLSSIKPSRYPLRGKRKC